MRWNTTVVAVATKDPEFAAYKGASEAPTYYGLQQQFFEGHEQPRREAVTVKEIGPARSAYAIILAALAGYATKFVDGSCESPVQVWCENLVA